MKKVSQTQDKYISPDMTKVAEVVVSNRNLHKRMPLGLKLLFGFWAYVIHNIFLLKPKMQSVSVCECACVGESLIWWGNTARCHCPHVRCKPAITWGEMRDRACFFPHPILSLGTSGGEEGGGRHWALWCTYFSSSLSVGVALLLCFPLRTRTHSCASLKLFHNLSVRPVCGEAVTYLFNISPSGNNGPRTQQALKVYLKD